MDTHTLGQLETYSHHLAEAVKVLSTRLHSLDSPLGTSPPDITKDRAVIYAILDGIRTLLDEPDHLLSSLTTQVEFLACLKWLAEFQILACIPPEGSLPIGDLAELTGVPDVQLHRVIRFTASSGFLQEPKSHHVSHTAMSARFLASQPLCDATIFIAASAIPSALRMADATRLTSAGRGTNTTAYDVAFSPQRPFRAACEEHSKLGRQWRAYLDHAASLHSEKELVETFSRLNWLSLGDACIVEVGAQSNSMARSLAKAFPNLHFFVQINNTDTLAMIRDDDRDNASESELLTAQATTDVTASARITVTFRETGMPQSVIGAAVYILHLPAVGDLARAELYRHLGPLRASGGMILVLTTRVLPEPGSLPNPRVEAAARARDLAMLQLANEGEMEMTELLQVVDSVSDDVGKLVVANRLASYNGLILALALKHVAHGV